MNRTWPPPQFICVGLEPNQQGQAALQRQASSSCPTIFHGVLSAAGFCATATGEAARTIRIAADASMTRLRAFIIRPPSGEKGPTASALITQPRPRRQARTPRGPRAPAAGRWVMLPRVERSVDPTAGGGFRRTRLAWLVACGAGAL